MVFWTLSIEERTTGWLGDPFHAAFRELLIHAGARYALRCPTYCLMPDHAHLLWMGTRRTSNQLHAMRFLKRETGYHLAGLARWQKQTHDHVLREEQREQDAFAQLASYILFNPVRAGLVVESERWPYAGCAVPGFPRLDPRDEGFWDLFWKLYAKERET